MRRLAEREAQVLPLEEMPVPDGGHRRRWRTHWRAGTAPLSDPPPRTARRPLRTGPGGHPPPRTARVLRRDGQPVPRAAHGDDDGGRFAGTGAARAVAGGLVRRADVLLRGGLVPRGPCRTRRSCAPDSARTAGGCSGRPAISPGGPRRVVRAMIGHDDTERTEPATTADERDHAGGLARLPPRDPRLKCEGLTDAQLRTASVRRRAVPDGAGAAHGGGGAGLVPQGPGGRGRGPDLLHRRGPGRRVPRSPRAGHLGGGVRRLAGRDRRRPRNAAALRTWTTSAKGKHRTGEPSTCAGSSPT